MSLSFADPACATQRAWNQDSRFRESWNEEEGIIKKHFCNSPTVPDLIMSRASLSVDSEELFVAVGPTVAYTRARKTLFGDMVI